MMKEQNIYIANIASYIIITFTLIFGAINILWLTWPYSVVDIEEPIPVLNENHEIAIGEPIVLQLNIDKQTDIAPDSNTANITCNDGNLVTMTSEPKFIPVGQFTVISDRYALPPKVAIGAECQFNFLNTYEVNPIRTISKTWSSETFTVVE